MAEIIYRDKTWEIKGGATVRDTLLKLGINPESVLVVRDGKLINEATIVRKDDALKVVAVISGGTSGG
jgi:sulfur carrier protein ThiS